jgi:hypothetical protein
MKLVYERRDVKIKLSYANQLARSLRVRVEISAALYKVV